MTPQSPEEELYLLISAEIHNIGATISGISNAYSHEMEQLLKDRVHVNPQTWQRFVDECIAELEMDHDAQIRDEHIMIQTAVHVPTLHILKLAQKEINGIELRVLEPAQSEEINDTALIEVGATRQAALQMVQAFHRVALN